jgi:hypothetical protein
MGTTVQAITVSTAHERSGSSHRPISRATTTLSGRAMNSTRAADRGSRPKKPPRTSVASTNNKTARTISATLRATSALNADANEPLMVKPTARPARTRTIGAVRRHRCSPFASTAQPATTSAIAISD